MRRIPPLALLLVCACAPPPELDARLTAADRAAPPPTLEPLAGVLASADALATVPVAGGDGRAEALEARAAALRGPVLTDAERDRLAEGPPAAPALP